MSEVQANIATEGPYYSLTVAEVVRETHDSCSLILDVPDELAETFAYRAGQFLTFRLRVGDKRLVRCYSLASSPASDPLHKVTVKRVEEGRVSNHVNDAIAAGATLEVMKPAGVFCLQERLDANRPIALLSGGSGITPVISIIKTALASTGRPLRLLYANRDERSIIFRAELEALAAANPGRFEMEHSLDETDGFVDVDRARRFASGSTGADFYVCGPGPFMDVAEAALAELGVPGDRIFIERFLSLSEEPLEGLDAGGAEGSVVVSVILDGVTTEITCGPDEAILHAARRAGLEPPFACEEAYCGCCMAMVKDGDVEMKMNDGGIDASQIQQGWVLTCQGVPKSAKCTVEYPD
ncbi:MAG: ferredoxin--NADP reductase [Myxococcota bacterium]|nr:ferredoxin--NADP reductase [Myxococcota bacterium]